MTSTCIHTHLPDHECNNRILSTRVSVQRCREAPGADSANANQEETLDFDFTPGLTTLREACAKAREQFQEENLKLVSLPWIAKKDTCTHVGGDSAVLVPKSGDGDLHMRISRKFANNFCARPGNRSRINQKPVLGESGLLNDVKNGNLQGKPESGSLRDGDVVQVVLNDDGDCDLFKIVENNTSTRQSEVSSQTLDSYHVKQGIKFIAITKIDSIRVEYDGKVARLWLPHAKSKAESSSASEEINVTLPSQSPTVKDIKDQIRTLFGNDDDLRIGLKTESSSRLDWQEKNNADEACCLHDIGVEGPHLDGVRVRTSRRRLSTQMIHVFVRTLTGTTTTMQCSAYQTVDDVNEFILEREGIPIEQQRLLFGGMQLESGRTLFEYNILNESLLHLVLRLRGGMYHSTSSRADFETLLDHDNRQVTLKLLFPNCEEQEVQVSPWMDIESLKQLAILLAEEDQDGSDEEDNAADSDDEGDSALSLQLASDDHLQEERKRLRAQLLDIEMETERRKRQRRAVPSSPSE